MGVRHVENCSVEFVTVHALITLHEWTWSWQHLDREGRFELVGPDLCCTACAQHSIGDIGVTRLYVRRVGGGGGVELRLRRRPEMGLEL